GLFVVGGLWLGQTRTEYTYRTDEGLSRIVLKDGSVILLNTNTELRVHMDTLHRDVNIVRGEAHFTVAHETERPFDVSAGGRLVRAVGTAFDVRLTGDGGMAVMVTEGRVALVDPSDTGTLPGDPGAATTISAGESVIASKGKIVVHRMSPSEALHHLAWQ